MTPASVVAVIPVRGGSKGVPQKNLRLLAGRPLLSFTIDAAKQAASVDRVIVSTDSDELYECAISLGAEAWKHPGELSADQAPTVGVVRWVAEQIEADDPSDVTYVTLRATTPFRSAEDVDAAVSLLGSVPEADSVVSVMELVGGHPKRLKVIQDGWVVDAFDCEGNSPIRRQDLQPVYIRNGGIYAAYSNVIRRDAMWGERCLAYIMPPERSININTPFDLLVADLLARHG
jgi:CMP-N-acetylneuraminic acid synthetase